MDEIDETILRDYVATANNPEYNGDWDIINSKFPELKDVDKQLLKDYVATANNPEYNGDYSIVNYKFPELFEATPDVKKKEQTEPTRNAPLLGLGGVSEEPSPSPSVGQGVFRYADQTQPAGERFISQVSEGVLDQAPVEADVPAEKKDPEWLIELLGRDANKYESVDETLNQIEGEKKDLDELESLGFETQEQIDSYNKRVNRFNERIKGAKEQISENDRYQAEQGEIERISSLLENPKPLKNPLDSYDELEREALDIAGIDAPSKLEARAKEQQRVQKQSASNNTLFGIDEPNEFLEDYTELPPPNYIKTDDGLKLYFSAQVGELQRRVNQALSDPEAYGFPKRIMSANEEDIQNLTNELYRQAQVKRESPLQYSNRNPLTGGILMTHNQPLPIESQGEDFVNLDESYFRKATKSAIANYQANFNNVRNKTLLNAISRDYAKAGYNEKGTRTAILGELSNQEKWGADEKILYDINNELKSARDQLASSSPQSSRHQSIQQNYNDILLKAEDARKELGSDREAFYDMRTGERVDKIERNSPHVMNLTMQIQDEMEKLTFEEDIEDVYIKAGLADNEHKFYGRNTRYDFDLRLFGPSASFALDYLVSKGYKPSEKGQLGAEGGLKTKVIGFENVSLDDISNWFVRSALDRHGNEKLSEEAERWHDRNVDLMSKRISARNMSLLNIDPGPVKKEQATHPIWGYDLYPTRMLEVIGETVLPKGVTESIGMSDVKFVDIAMSQLESHGIELTEAQKENAKRSISLEVQEGVASFVPIIGELAVANKALGVVKAVSGFKKIVDAWRVGSKFERGLAIASDALIEEGTMQFVGMKPGAGSTFNILGNRFRKYGLDKFPLRFKGELARLNKIGDSVWSNALTGTITMEAAATMEAAIDDFAGGETMQNYLEENYSDLSEIGKRQIVNVWVFNIIGGRGLIGKGKSGLRIRRMEEARDELQKNGEMSEADILTGYIKEYYSGKPGKAQNISYNDMKTTVDNIPDNKSVTFTVSSREEIPVEFRDKKIYEEEGVEKEVDKTFLGIPIGKKTVTGKTYSYDVTGKEMREMLEKRQGEKTEAEFEQEFDGAQKTEEPSVGKEVMRTEPVEKEPTYEEPEVFTSPKEAEYAEVNRNDGKGDVMLTKEEYEMEMARKFAETQPTPKEPAAKEQLALGEGKAAPKEDAPVEEIKTEPILREITSEEKKESVLPEQDNLGMSDKKFNLKNESSFGDKGSVGVYVNPANGSEDVFMVIPNRTDDSNYIGYKRVYENGKPTNKFSIKAEMSNAEKGEAKKSFQAVSEALPEGHVLIETENISSDGLILWSNQIKNNYSPTGNVFEVGVNLEGKKVVLGGTRSTGSFSKGNFTEEESVKAEKELNKLIENIDGAKVVRKKISPPGTPNIYHFRLTLPELKIEPVSAPTEVAEEAAPVELKEGEIDITTVFKNPVEKNNEQAVAASNEFKDKAGEYDEGVNDPKFKEENTTIEEISVNDIVPTQEKLFEENLKSPSKGEPLVMKVGDKYYIEDGHHRIGNEINADKQTVSVRIYEAGTPKIEPLTKEEAKSEEKVKEFVEKNLSDEKKNEEADKEIESKSEEELKEDVPDVLESISEAEREKLDREAKFKRKSTIDYVIDYLKGKIKNVRQSIKNILDKIKSNYRKAIIGTTIIVDLATMGTGVKLAEPKVKDAFKESIEFVSPIVKEVSKSSILSFAESNKESFSLINETVQASSLSESIKGNFANVASQSGAVGKLTDSDIKKVNNKGVVTNFLGKPTENKIPRDEPGDAPIGLMALPLLFGGVKRRRKPLEDTDADKVVTEWMGDVQKIYDAQKTKNKEEARNQAAVNLALSGKLDNLAPDQVKAVLEGIQTETGAMGKKWSVSTLSELDGLTIKQQFKQGFEEYVAAMKQKEADKIKKAKDSAQKKIDAAKERTAKVIEKIKDDKEARKLFEAIVNDLAKDSGLSQISRNKASELLKSSRDVNANNIEKLLEKAVRIIEYEYKRNIVKESDKKIKDFKTNIEKNKFGTLTKSAKELAGITTEDIPIGLLPRFVDVMDGLSKKSPSAKDLEELAKFMSEFKNELDQQITDVQYFADVLNDFKTQEETEKIDDYLKENGFSESQIEFFKNNRKAINAAYKSFYQKEVKQKDGLIKIEDLSAQEIFNKKEEQMLEAKEVFNKMKTDGEAKVDMKKFKGKVQQELNIAEFFNNIKDSDIDYLTRTEANKIPVLFDNLNRGMVTTTIDKIMTKIIGGRTLDSFEKLDPKSPIKRAETIDGLFKSFSSNSKEIKALGLRSDPISLKSSREAFDQIKEKVLDYADEVFKDLKGKPLYEQVGKIMRPIVNVNIKMAKIFDEINDLERKMDGSPLYNTVLMEMYFRSREFDLNPDNKRAMNPIEYIEATLESANLLPIQREVIKEIRNTYFRKKQGDQKSKPNTKEMLNEIKKRKGGALIELMDKTLESYQPIVQFISEVKQSSPVDWYKGYFTRSSLENGSKGIEDLLSDVSNSVGRPSLKAGAAQSRQPGKHALNFNAIDNFKKSIASIELQYNAGQAISEVNAFISEAKRSGNMDAKIFAETLKKVVDAYVKNTLSQEYKDSKILGSRLTAKLFDSAGKKIKTATLAGALKVIKDGTAQTGKILIDEDARNALFKLVSLRKESKIPSTQEILDTLKSLHSARSGVLSAEMRKNQSYILDALRKGTATSTEKALYSLSKLKGVELVSALDNFLMNFSTGLIKSPDLMGTVQLVVGASAIKFKEITGQELDFNKLVSSPEYRAKYKEELEAAVSYGDQITTRIGGPGTVSQKPINEISEKNRLRIMDRFVRAFSTFESQQIQSAISTLIPPASKFTGRERGAEFENKRKAAQGLLASIYGLVGYASIGIVLNELADYAIMFLLGYEDDDELFQDFDSEAASTRVVSDVAWTSMFGKLGVTKTLILQSAIAGGVRLAGEFAENEEDKELANKIADSMFYSTINKKTTIQKLAKSSGPEAKLVGAAAELIYDTSDDIVKGLNEESGKPKPYESETKLLENPRFVQNLYTLSQGVISQGPAQEIGKLVRTSTYEQDLSRKMNEAFRGKSSDESRSSLDYTEKKILRLRKRTGDRYLIPSMVSLTKNITKNGVTVKFKLNQGTVYELQRLKADFIKGEAEKLFKTNTYINANDSEKSKLLKEIYGDWGNSNSEFIEKFYFSKGKVE
jgi:hypothetical protein